MGVNCRRKWIENEYRIDWPLHLSLGLCLVCQQSKQLPVTCLSCCSLKHWLLSVSRPFCAFPTMAFKAMWGCEMSLAHRGQNLAQSNHDSSASPANQPYYTEVLALILLLMSNSRILQRPTPKTYHVFNLSQDSQRVGTDSLQVRTDECATVLSVKMIMAHALFFLRALQFLFIIFCTHLYNEQCLASHHLHTKKLFVYL